MTSLPHSTRQLKLVRTVARRPRLLLLAQTLPFPPDGGVHIRIYNVLKLLAREYDVTMMCFTRLAERDTRSVQVGVAALKEYAEVSAFPIPQEHSRWRLVWDHLRSLVQRRAYVWYAYDSEAFHAHLKANLMSKRFDVVQLDSLDLARYLPALAGYPVVCVHHNVESALMAQRAEREPRALVRWYLHLQSRLLEKLERAWAPRVALNVTVSDSDQAVLEGIAPTARVTTVPNGVDTETFQPSHGATAEEGIVSTGGLNWFPNADALTHFCDDILPRVRATIPGASVRWVGRASDETITQRWADSRVELTGHVEDIRPYVREAACFVVPLRVGGGTRLKILDAWAMGKAVVSTSVGCAGLRAVDGENILIRDDPEGFANAVADVLRNPTLRKRLGAAGRKTVEETYSWAVIGRGIARSLDSIHADAALGQGTTP
jgi:glycosyltransferase involved in cell wall biosynthesis